MDSYDDYGFIPWNELPSLNYESDSLPYTNVIQWARMSDYRSNTVYNHCGATAVTNMALYFYYIGYSNAMCIGDTDLTFDSVHGVVPNGPLSAISGYAQQYFRNCGYSLEYSSVSSFEQISAAINSNRPCALLLMDTIINQHWILAVGWKLNENDYEYIRIVTGWDYAADYYYMVNIGSTLLSGQSYWIR